LWIKIQKKNKCTRKKKLTQTKFKLSTYYSNLCGLNKYVIDLMVKISMRPVKKIKLINFSDKTFLAIVIINLQNKKIINY